MKNTYASCVIATRNFNFGFLSIFFEVDNDKTTSELENFSSLVLIVHTVEMMLL